MFLYFAFSFLMGNKSLLLLHTIRSALFGLKKWSLITQFLSPITHHSSLKTHHPVWHHHSFIITQYFSIICGPIPVPCVAFTLFFFPSTPSTYRTQWEKNNSKNKNETHRTQKKEEGRTEDRTVKKKKKEKEGRRRPNPKKKGKKKVKGQKLRLWVPPYMFNYKNIIELWVMETKNS